MTIGIHYIIHAVGTDYNFTTDFIIIIIFSSIIIELHLQWYWREIKMVLSLYNIIIPILSSIYCKCKNNKIFNPEKTRVRSSECTIVIINMYN